MRSLPTVPHENPAREDPAYCECCEPKYFARAPLTKQELALWALRDRETKCRDLLRDYKRPGSMTDWLAQGVLFLLKEGEERLRLQIRELEEEIRG